MLLYIVIIIIFVILLSSGKRIEPYKNPCTDYLTDIEFIKHMIPHHQVAIDMSQMMEKHTTDHVILNICRNIIWQQKYEIWYMNLLLNGSVAKVSRELFNHEHKFRKLANDCYYKNDFEVKNICNPLFFKPDEHKMHMSMINEKMYLEHMIPHHQVAIIMSERLLKHTMNPAMMDLCRDIIRNQQSEILFMKNLLNSNIIRQSELLRNN